MTILNEFYKQSINLLGGPYKFINMKDNFTCIMADLEIMKEMIY